MNKAAEARLTRPIADAESDLLLIALDRLAKSDDPKDNKYRSRANRLRHLLADPQTEIIYPAVYFSTTERF